MRGWGGKSEDSGEEGDEEEEGLHGERVEMGIVVRDGGKTSWKSEEVKGK